MERFAKTAIAEGIHFVIQNGRKKGEPGSRNRNIHMNCHPETARTSALAENMLSGLMMPVVILAMVQSHSGLRLAVRSSGEPNLLGGAVAASRGTDIEGQAGLAALPASS